MICRHLIVEQLSSGQAEFFNRKSRPVVCGIILYGVVEKKRIMQDQRHDENGHIRNLNGQEAIEKLQALAEDARTCMFITHASPRPHPARPMALIKAEDDGSLYFFSAASSEKNKELSLEPFVQLIFANNAASEYLDISGTASVSRDREKIDEIWTEFAKIWFQGGKDDPDLTLIKVTPDVCNYWDTKNNKLVQWLKMGASFLTGQTMDDGVEGRLNV